MTGIAEATLSTVALLGVAVLAAAGVRDLLRQRRDRQSLSRLAAGGAAEDADPDQPPAPVSRIVHHLRAAGFHRVS